MSKLSVCVEMVFADRPMPERIAATAAVGADAFEFWGWRDKDLDAIADARDDAGIDLAAMTAGGGTLTDPDNHDDAVAAIEESVGTAERLDCPNLIVTVGQEQDDLDRGPQHDAIVDVLRAAAPAAEDAGVELVVEPLNTAVDHPGYYLTSSFEGYQIVDEVGSDNVRLLFDIYHQQITEGNLIENVTEHVDSIGHFHLADVPGRHEPGTGELNYGPIFDAIQDTGYDRYVGCEFVPTDDHEAAMEHVVSLWE